MGSPHCTAWIALAPGLSQKLESCTLKGIAQRNKMSSGQWPQCHCQPKSIPSQTGPEGPRAESTINSKCLYYQLSTRHGCIISEKSVIFAFKCLHTRVILCKMLEEFPKKKEVLEHIKWYRLD